MYIQSILKHGFLLPALLGTIFCVGAKFAVGKFEEVAENKKSKYEAYQSDLADLELYKSTINRYKESLISWQKLMDKEAQSKLFDKKLYLEEILNKELILKLNERATPGENAIIKASTMKGKIKTYNFNQEWDGSFSELQKMFVIQETQLPTLCLQSLTIKPSNAGVLNIESLHVKAEYFMYDQKIKLTNLLKTKEELEKEKAELETPNKKK